MSKKYIEFKVSGHEEELKSFTTLLQLIQSFGRYGMSRKVKVDVDGDGSGQLKFSIITKDGDEEELPTFELDDLRQLETTTNKTNMDRQYKVYIGE